MLSRSAATASVAVCAAALLAPTPALAQSPVSVHRDALAPLVERTERAHDRAVRRNVQLHRANTKLRGARPDRGRAAELRDWSTDHVLERNRALRERNRVLRRRAAAPVATPAHLQAIAACESGGDPSAVGGGGAYRGKYQFDLGTWASVGGTGDPAAAPEAEQDRRAAILYARAGASPWPVCGG